MKADTLTLSKLFKAPVCYLVPLFQRPYVWEEEKHWDPLWEDMRTVAERLLAHRPSGADESVDGGNHDLSPHFLGAIVLEQVPTGAGMIERRRVIDGQQRLTTLQLVLDAAHDVARERDLVGAKFFAKLTDNDPDLVATLSDQYKVWPTNIDQEAFRQTMQKDTQAMRGDLPEASRTRIGRAHGYFSHAIAEWLDEARHISADDRLDVLREVMWQLITLVVIDLETNDNAQVIFETLNARGTPLLASDLIKNTIFQMAIEQRLDQDDLYGRFWRALDSPWWREEVTQGRLHRPRLDLFLAHWLTMQLGRDFSAHELFTQFKGYARGNVASVGQILGDIADYATVYRSFDAYPIDSAEGRFFYRLRATETTTVFPALLYALRLHRDQQLPDSELVLLMNSIESWLIRRMICGLTTKNYNQVFLQLLRILKESPSDRLGVVTASFLGELQGESQRWPNDEEIRQALRRPLYGRIGRNRLRMVLEALEEAKWTDLTEPLSVPKNLQIEHVLPQTWERNWPLPAGSDLEAKIRRDELKHAIGNLTLVTKKLNPTMSNGPWVGEGEGNKREALRQHSVLRLNAEIIENEVWDESCIEARCDSLAELAARVWPGPSPSTTALMEQPARRLSAVGAVGVPAVDSLRVPPEVADLVDTASPEARGWIVRLLEEVSGWDSVEVRRGTSEKTSDGFSGYIRLHRLPQHVGAFAYLGCKRARLTLRLDSASASDRRHAVPRHVKSTNPYQVTVFLSSDEALEEALELLHLAYQLAEPR